MKHLSLTYIVLVALIGALLTPASSYAAKPKTTKAKAAKVSTAERDAELLRQATEAFNSYLFDDAIDLLSDISSPSTESEALLQRAETGQSMMQRIERIQVIDSIIVDRDDFFRAYHLSAPTGRIDSRDALPEGVSFEAGTTVFISEDGESMLWGSHQPSRLVGSSLLMNGEWESPSTPTGALEQIEGAAFPFLSADGTTLYFAAKGPESLGGYDIFITRHNGEQFLAPQNMGMPYNSPADDYLLAIDELTGAGWWATDRNNIPGKVTIYIFIPQELRANYPADTPDIERLARLESIAMTRRADDEAVALRQQVLDSIAKIATADGPDASLGEFEFFMPGDRGVYTTLDDFRNPQAADVMETYLDTKADLDDADNRLDALRQQWAAGDHSVASEITELENTVRRLRHNLQQLAARIINLETNQ